MNSKIGQRTLRFPGLCRAELDLGTDEDRLGVTASKFHAGRDFAATRSCSPRPR